MKRQTILTVICAAMMSLCICAAAGCAKNDDEKELSSISVTTQPVKLEYTVGELFDDTGMVVTAKYSDDTTAVVTDYTIDKTEPLTLEDDKVTVTYQSKTATINITVKEAVPEHTHAFDKEVAEEKYLASAATCTEAATYYKSCECGEKGTEKFTVGKALGHDLKSYQAKQPTCTEIGWDAYEECSRCDYTTYSEKKALGHDYGEWEQTKAPTCTDKGTEQRVCSHDASHIETRDIAALGHDYGEPEWSWTDKTGATATFTCKNDGNHVETVTAKITTKEEPATCTQKGKTIYTAEVSFNGKTYKDEIIEESDMLPHSLTLSITSTKTEYNVGEKLDLASITGKLACSACDYNQDVDITEDMLSAVDMDTAGIKTVTVTYSDEYTATFEIKVIGTYRLEGENADITTFDGRTLNAIDNLGFDVGFSGNLAPRNTNKKGDIATFTFNSDSASQGVTLDMYFSGYPGKDLALSEIVKITLNDVEIDTTGITVNKDDCVQIGSSVYMLFKHICLTVDISKDINTLKFEYIGGFGGNIEYIDIKAAANITIENNALFGGKMAEATWDITVEPTPVSEGEFCVKTIKDEKEVSSRFVLPKLEKYGIYTFEQNGKMAEYTFVHLGQEYTFSYDSETEYNLELLGGVKFSDGTTAKKVHAYEEVELNLNELVVPEGKKVAGLYDNAGGALCEIEDNKFIAPGKDTSLMPVYETANGFIGDENSLSSGKFRLFPYDNPVSGSKWRNNDCYMYNSTLGAVKSVDGTSAEVGSMLHVAAGTPEAPDPEGTLSKGFYGMIQTQYNAVGNKQYTVNLTVANMGNEALKLQFYMSRSSGTPRPTDDKVGNGSEVVELAAGETKEVTFTFMLSQNNSSLMFVFDLLNETPVSEIELGAYMYMSYAE